MQFLKINKDTTLTELTKIVGSRNVDSVLNLNSLSRQPNIGEALSDLYDTITEQVDTVSYQRKASILNGFTSDADVFETAALLDSDGWKLLSDVGTLPSMLRIPETLTLADSVNILGGGKETVGAGVYSEAMKYLNSNQDIDPVIFNTYSSRQVSQIQDTTASAQSVQWFNLPWGLISLYSSLSNTSIDFPTYPKGFSDGVEANYDTMPDMIYQYEPWQIYKGSGPRTNTYEFDIHRDMWSGDHRDGKANELIRFCEANCYPRIQGASVQTSTVTLYIGGVKHITGVLTNVKINWDEESPIGLDKFFLHFTIALTITEVSEMALTYDSVKNRGIIE